MQIELAKALVDVLEQCGEEASLYEEYSGRSMYGRTTTGVVCNGLGTLLTAVISSPDSFLDEHGCPQFEDADCFVTDSMGLDTIIY